MMIQKLLLCERCATKTIARQELFNGRVATICDGCWKNAFSDEQRTRITAARDARHAEQFKKSGLAERTERARSIVEWRETHRTACEKCRKAFVFQDEWEGERRQLCPVCWGKARAAAAALAARNQQRGRPHRPKSRSIRTVSGGLPSLGKRR